MAADQAIRREGIPREEPFAVVAEKKSALRLQVLNEAAEGLGLYEGMALADARGAVPQLLTRPQDLVREERLLFALHRWAHRFSPFVGMDPPDALALDSSGCAHLFGGEEAMVDAVRGEAEALGFQTRAALADTKGAAQALARFGGEDSIIVPPGESAQMISTLPVAALGDESRHLRRLGLKTLGDVARLPGADLTKRFGASMTRHLEEAFGRSATPVAPVAMRKRYSGRLSFPDPIGMVDDVTAAVQKILSVLCEKLEEDGRGITALEIIVQRADSTSETRHVGMARSTIDQPAIMRQWQPIIEGIDSGYGIDVIRMIVRGHAPLEVKQSALGQTTRKGSIDDLIGTLGNRLGFDRVTRPAPAESHLPGFNQVHIPAVASDAAKAWPSRLAPDPLRLFPGQPLEPLSPGRPPQSFRWRGKTFRVRSAEGPRRILPEWWQDEPERRAARDYWRVETEDGQRLWLGAEPQPEAERHWSVYGELP
ncbi:MAG: DUF6504 family protein [Pseudomonadota bacterium]